MSSTAGSSRVSTGVDGLDQLLEGGIPAGTMTVLAGPPGAGKTILAQQLCFASAARGERVLYMTTLSEPGAKLLRYLRPFTFFDQRLFEEKVVVVDLGKVLREEGFQKTVEFIVAQLERVQPEVVVVDSFKVFDDLARSSAELRTFSYEIAVHLLAWECTSVLLGEYGERDLETNPIFSVSDGLIRLRQEHVSGEPQRLINVVKMRGTAHSRDGHPFIINADGLELVTTELMPGLRPAENASHEDEPRLRIGIPSLDALLGSGIPLGSSILVAGPAGTGKTVLGLQFLHEGCRQFDEPGIFFSVQEPKSKLLANARSFGWDLEGDERSGKLEIHCVPHPQIRVDEDLLHLKERVRKLGARRVVVDSTSTLLHRLGVNAARDRFYLLANLLREVGAVGLMLSEIPFGSPHLIHLANEDTVADGVFLLDSRRSGNLRQRELEIVKLRNVDHEMGAFAVHIGKHGFRVDRRSPKAAKAASPRRGRSKK